MAQNYSINHLFSLQFKELMNKIDQDDEEDEDGNPIGGGGGGNPNYTPSKVNNNPITRGALNNGRQSVTPLKLKLGIQFTLIITKLSSKLFICHSQFF